MGNVSVEAAMKKAIRIRNITLLIIIPYFIPCMIFLAGNGYSGTIVLSGTILCFVFCFIVGAIYNKIAMERWRIWAFTNVRNVHELRNAAIQYMFVPESKLHFSVEFPSASFKQKWKALQYRFDTPDEILEDITLPDTVIIPANRVQRYQNLHFSGKDDVLRINCDGIEIGNTLYRWESITKVSFRRVFTTGDQTSIALCLQVDHEEQIIPLTYYKTNRYQLNNIIQTYKIRHGKLNQ